MLPSRGEWGEFPCAECGKRIAGLRPGDRCPECRWRIEGRATLIARRAALVAVLGYGVWALAARPASPAWLVAAAAPVTYLVVRLVAYRIAVEA
ncbi:MAG TPA: hypothetical protein PLL69_12215, partial [Gemmatimonadales bacterium]|nr:hypothetical protein [Gemmatimonadales bacterium]